MITLFFFAYLSSLAAGYVTTLVLILVGSGWKSLPHKYLQAVLFIQGFFAKDYTILENIIEKQSSIQFAFFSWGSSTASTISSRPSSTTSAEYSCCDVLEVDSSDNASSIFFETNLQLVCSGLEAIIEDEVLNTFRQAPLYQIEEPKGLLKRMLFSFRQFPYSEGKLYTLVTNFLLLFSEVIRVAVLFPIRLALILTSFVFLIFCCILACFIDFSAKFKTKIAVLYCRLFTAGTGLVARYHNPENRPKRPGVAVANHLSPNDIQIICADVDPQRSYLYTVTGQKHQGIIWTIERLVEKLCPSIWLERASAEERKSFTLAVLHVAKTSGPVLIFPEGYCTNNTKVLQFRRAVFEEGVNVHPIAIKQDARFGDCYWSEDKFFHYLLRLLTSWATVCDIFYLPVQHREPDETSTEFARRVQCLIAEAVDCPPASFDGGLFYKQAEKTKLLKFVQQNCAQQFVFRKNIVISSNNEVQPQVNKDDFTPKTIIENLAIPMQIDFPSSVASSSSYMSNGFTHFSKEDSTEEQNLSEGQASSVSLLEEEMQMDEEEEYDDGSLLNG